MRPPENTPAQIAREAGLDVAGKMLTWEQIVDAAAQAYWRNRPQPYRDPRHRHTVEQWMHRAGEVA